jgi:hypothetical protein
VLTLPEGTVTSTPDSDFDRFRRGAETGGRPFAIRPVMVLDSMEPYPGSDAAIGLVAPDDVCRPRIDVRDQIWKTRVGDRLHHLAVTWAHAWTLIAACDLELDGTAPLAANAEHLANWLRREFPARLIS